PGDASARPRYSAPARPDRTDIPICVTNEISVLAGGRAMRAETGEAAHAHDRRRTDRLWLHGQVSRPRLDRRSWRIRRHADRPPGDAVRGRGRLGAAAR